MLLQDTNKATNNSVVSMPQSPVEEQGKIVQRASGNARAAPPVREATNTEIIHFVIEDMQPLLLAYYHSHPGKVEHDLNGLETVLGPAIDYLRAGKTGRFDKLMAIAKTKSLLPGNVGQTSMLHLHGLLVLKAIFRGAQPPTNFLRTAQEIENAYNQACLAIAPNLSHLTDLDGVEGIKCAIMQAHDLIARQDIDEITDMLERYARQTEEKPDSPAGIAMVALQVLCQELDIPISANLVAKVKQVADRYRMPPTHFSHPADIRFDWSQKYHDVDAALPFKPNDFSHFLRDTRDGEYGQDEQAVALYTQLFQWCIDRAARAYNPQAQDPVTFFDESIDMGLAAVKSAATDAEYAVIQDYTDQFRHYVKTQWMDTQDPSKVKAAMRETVEKILKPAKAGRTIHTGQRVDGALAGKLILNMQHLAENFEEHHDIKRYFSESEAYLKTSGSLRNLANQALGHFFTKMDLPCPELSLGQVYGASR